MMKAQIGLVVLMSVVVAACERSRPVDWPALPSDSLQARELVDRHTRRPADGGRLALTADGLLAKLRARVEQGEAVGGMDGLVFWIWRKISAAGRAGKNSYILWGTYHDSGAQMEAFVDLVGPLGLSKLDAVCIEQFNADGRWAGVPSKEQKGDSALLSDYLATGSRAVLEKLLHGQISENYTAWKYGILKESMDLLAKARAAGRKLLGCDMSLALQKRITNTKTQDRLRELHCVLALEEELGRRSAPHRVAMLWGQGHLAPEGVQRFLPQNALVLPFYVFGGRFSRQGLEADLAGRLAITDPLMIPITESEFVVLLPDELTGARKELKHVPPEAPLSSEERRRLTVTSSRAGTIQIGSQSLKVSEEPQTLILEPGSHVFLFTHKDGLLAGAVTMPPDGFLELDLDLDPRKSLVEVTVHRRTR
jgi:hypothetical protein